MPLTTEENLKHAESMKKTPDREHTHPNAKKLAPKKTGEIVWKFSAAAEFDYARLIPGHREAGMIGTVVVKQSNLRKERNMTNSKLAATTLALSLLASPATFAQDAMVKGEVKKVDEAAKKITLKHGPIKSLDMDEGMTMVFRVQDPAMLKQVRVGDKVQFVAERSPSGITITKIQKGK